MNMQAVNIEQELFDISQHSIQIHECTSHLTEMCNLYDTIFDTMTELDFLSENISKHGISKSLIMCADPTNYMATNFGFPSLEDLSSDPAIDKNAYVAMEALNDKMKAFIDTIIKYFNMLIKALAKLFKKVIAMFDSYKKILDKYETIFEDAAANDTFDTDKAKEISLTAPIAATLTEETTGTYSNIDKLIQIPIDTIINKNYNDPNKMKEEFDAAFGTLGPPVGRPLKLKITDASLESLGYTVGATRNIITAAKASLRMSQRSDEIMKSYQKAIDEITAIAEATVSSAEEEQKVRSALNVAKLYVTKYKGMLITSISNTKICMTHVIAVCKAMEKCI